MNQMVMMIAMMMVVLTVFQAVDGGQIIFANYPAASCTGPSANKTYSEGVCYALQGTFAIYKISTPTTYTVQAYSDKKCKSVKGAPIAAVCGLCVSDGTNSINSECKTTGGSAAIAPTISLVLSSAIVVLLMFY